MSRLPWTKFQDFYLRLGYLKALVAILSPDRRSALNDALVRRLESPLFDPAPNFRDLWKLAESLITWYPRRTPAGRLVEYPEVSEALLVVHGEESVLYGITRDTTYKVVDWGHDVEFLGRGNQITERALLLRKLLDQSKADAFFSGDVMAWDLFRLSVREKLFFIFHLDEIDGVTVEVAQDLAKVPRDKVLESRDAAEITCRALFRVLDAAERSLAPRDIPAYRTARELAVTIAEELELADLSAQRAGVGARRSPRSIKPSARRSAFSPAGAGDKVRRTRKNADHQTIPRFEQLVDLGFLNKPTSKGEGSESSPFDGRKRWQYVPTDVARRWASAREFLASKSMAFRWAGFAAASVAAFHDADIHHVEAPPIDEVARRLWEAYVAVHRPMGHTPLDSVALFGMITAAAEGVIVEMVDFHNLLLEIKKGSLMPEHVFFASGNDLDKMFVQIKPGFLERFHLIKDQLPRAGSA